MRVPFRWALPIFHLAMDLILVVMLMVQLLRWMNHPNESGSNRGLFVPVSYDRHVQYVFDGRSPGSIGPTSLLITGTLPAGVISCVTLFATRGQLDIPYGCLIWLGLFEGIAAPLWLFASRIPTAYDWCLASICVRVLAVLTVLSKLWGVGAGLQVLFWVTATFYAFAVGVRWTIKRFRLGALSKRHASAERA
jgi:hypothetical protein